MSNLSILFTGKELHWRLGKGRKAVTKSYFLDSDSEKAKDDQFLGEEVTRAFQQKGIEKIEMITAYNHFTMVPLGFDYHKLGYQLISYNSQPDENEEELMLAVNKKNQVQFYYTLPHSIYDKLKAISIPKDYTFSGDRFLNKIAVNKKKDQVHIHLYQNRVEFFVIEKGKIMLYNNLDSTSEVDFLYFIMFAVSKLKLNLKELQFFVYGNIVDNDTFLSELQKFSSQVYVVSENLKDKVDFILS